LWLSRHFLSERRLHNPELFIALKKNELKK